MKTFDIKTITGVIPAMITTFDEKEELDTERGFRFTHHLIGKGVNGLYLTGTNGCSYFMTGEERKKYAETVIKAADKEIPVIVHVGEISTKKSIDLAVHAQDAGADAISSVPPFYFKFSEEDIYSFYKDLSSSVSIPMIVYNNPNSGLLNLSFIERLAGLPNVKGLKFTSKDHDDMALIKRNLGKDFMVYSGCDQMAVSGLLAGADGIIGGYYNLIPETFIEIYKRCRSGDFSRAFELQIIAVKLIREFAKYTYTPLAMHYLREMDVDVGFFRRPYSFPSAEKMVAIENFLLNMKKEFGDTRMDFLEHKFS